jgi:hypothetical protein
MAGETGSEARSHPRRLQMTPVPSPCLFSLSCRSNSSKSDMLRWPRRALCSSCLALPPARSGRFGYFRRWLRLLPAAAGAPSPT